MTSLASRMSNFNAGIVLGVLFHELPGLSPRHADVLGVLSGRELPMPQGLPGKGVEPQRQSRGSVRHPIVPKANLRSKLIEDRVRPFCRLSVDEADMADDHF